MNYRNNESWLVVGLGNPGDEYAGTRHNLGFMVVDRLAADFGADIRRSECRSLIGGCLIENQRVELAKPQTFMNVSGEAISCLLKKSGRSATLIVVSDDLALPFGSIRLRQGGSHGGHNGLRSIIDSLKTSDFIRLRVGISPEHPISDTKRFVLEKFSRNERGELDELLKICAAAVGAVIRDGVEFAQAVWNSSHNHLRPTVG